ncbi:Uncharacterized protein OBRU01_23542 [Operophtera brumata]|uniref:Uncharacterized protein n=1 Tax=Operophtera brumata TaxID=104452 RepID=A0A0L7KP15_OPEBR|nr:Uncharacterized protein OBRU01_23542 [Operophtera brumata]
MILLDASAKIPSGIMTGNVNDLGDYYQCLSIDEFVNDWEIQGKYCAITIPLNQENPITIPQFPEFPEFPDIDIPWPPTTTEVPNPDTGEEDEETDEVRVARQYEALRRYAMGISGLGEPVENRISPMVITQTSGSTLGICVPKVCTATEAVDFLQNRIRFINITYNEFFCRLPNDKLFSPADYIYAVVKVIFVFILDPKTANTLYRCFSVYTNTRRFLTFNTVPGALECIDGIRAISMLWVVVGHTYSFTLMAYIHNMADTVTWLTKFSSTWINSAPITVDTFFCLSGILAVYTTVGKISRGRFIRTIHLFYINRLLRMFPILAAVVLLQASLFNHFSDGPFWMNVSQQAQNCRTWWWSALLHVQNYVNAVEICIPQTWYLSVDVQLYFFCPIIMVWLFGREMIAWLALCAIVVISLASSTAYSFVYDFSAALFNPARLSEFNEYTTIYYINTLTRAPPFFIGMIYGYLLHICRDKQLKISKINVVLLWILSFTMMAFCIFSIYPAMQLDHEGQLFDNFLNAYMRAIWACALGWLIFACVHGYGGTLY